MTRNTYASTEIGTTTARSLSEVYREIRSDLFSFSAVSANSAVNFFKSSSLAERLQHEVDQCNVFANSCRVGTRNMRRNIMAKITITGEKSIPIGGSGRIRLTNLKAGSVTL
jgi:hypothetical protein